MRSGTRALPERILWVVITSMALCLFPHSALIAEPVQPEQARRVVDTFLSKRLAHPRATPKVLVKAVEGAADAGQIVTGLREIRDDDGTTLAYVADLNPRGFIATSADTDITPIVAYSLRNSLPAGENNPLYCMLKEDMRRRARALAEYTQFKTARTKELWDIYACGAIEDSANETFEQWPQEGTTSTGGWLETTWDQDAPYNAFCPLDPVDGIRSYVGCVATALAQVVNYHQKCDVYFDRADSYMTYGGINVDADSDLYDFPSFEELNDYLSALVLKYDTQSDLNDTDVAALSFACGVAVDMDYSSEGSGASRDAVQEALLEKFGYHSAEMTGGLSSQWHPALQENLINGLPAFLGIGPPDCWGGHMLVCDGYNTNSEYHLNFGWGAEHPDEILEAWYSLPEYIPREHTVVEEVILNVLPDQPSIGVEPASLFFQGIPGEESWFQSLHVRNNKTAPLQINAVSCPEGFIIKRSGGSYSDHIDSFEIPSLGETSLSVKFFPDEAGSYYGVLKIDYNDDKTKYVILQGSAFAGGRKIGAGIVHGLWSKQDSPYFISGDIRVSKYSTLTIEPGVKVMFTGPYSMTVREQTSLIAVGNENEPIEFTALNRDVGWGGLRFVDSGVDDVLTHCSITFAKKHSAPIDDGGEDDNAEGYCGGGVYCFNSSPKITNCKITNNEADSAGAIYCLDSSPVITNTLIANNFSPGGCPRSGGVFTDGEGVAEILNCTIANNSPGGIFSLSYERVDVRNTIIWGNSEFQVNTRESKAELSFCNVQDGYQGQGNIDADPCFFAPTADVGIEYDASTANWAPQCNSPCINAGNETDADLPATDLAGNPRIHSKIVDIGAYENQSDLPLITVRPSGTLDAGFVRVDTNSVTSIGIANTGAMGFDIQSLSIPEGNDVFSIVTPVSDHHLAPTESVTVDIQFAPAQEKVYNGELQILSTSANCPEMTLALRGVGVAGTIVPEGPVSGTWAKADAPFTITGDIHVPQEQELKIEPGVVVKFAGHFGLTVERNANLIAEGTEKDNIIFTPTDTNEGWFGIRFVGCGNDDVLRYCTIEYSKKPRTGESGYMNHLGGGILCCAWWGDEPPDQYGMPDVTFSNPTIEHCLISHNHAVLGGAIACVEYGMATLAHTKIVDNTADLDGAGLYLWYDFGLIFNNVIANNSGSYSGGIMTEQGDAWITGNTIAQNRPNALYLGPACDICWDTPIINNIIWQNEIYVSEDVGPGDYIIMSNDIQGGWEGEGNIDVDPCFADPNNRDYHLKSEAGRWDPNAGTWVRDDVTSPCIDAGHPEMPWLDEFRPHGGRVNMGAYGGTKQASLSNVPDSGIADLNGDGSVDYKDMTLLVDKWLDQGLLAEDIDRNGVIGLGDFCIIAESWLHEDIEPEPKPVGGLVSHWRFDEGAGETAYDSVSDKHGTIHGAIWTAGKINGALRFDGYGDYVRMPEFGLAEFQPDCTIAAWTKTDTAFPNYGVIASCRQQMTPSVLFELDREGGGFRFTVRDAAGTAATASNYCTLTPGNWYHIVGIREGDDLVVYVNGDRGTVVSPWSDRFGIIWPSTLTIGALDCCGLGVHHHFDGTIDEVMLFDRALSGEEVNVLYGYGAELGMADSGEIE